jgi:hypothetical protein
VCAPRNGDQRMLIARAHKIVAWIAFVLLTAWLLIGSWQSSRHQPTKTYADRNGGNENSAKPKEDGFWNWIAHDAAGFFTPWLVLVGGAQVGLFVWQLRLIKKTLAPAKEAAEAAKLNAEAVMTAEGAHLFPIIKKDNLKECFLSKPAAHSDVLPNPNVTYIFKNYGKTPAKLISVMHGMSFFERPSKNRTMHLEDERALEIIAGNAESGEIELFLSDVLTATKAEAVLEYRSQILFFGEAAFKDFFDRQFRCIWEFEGRFGGFKLIRHEQRADPDEKR